MRRLRIALALPFAWVLADLFFGVNLPGAATLEHLAFQLLAWLPQWLPEGEFRARNLSFGLGIGFVLLLAAGRRALPLWRGLALVLVGAELLVAVVALLMERALGVGIIAGVLTAVLLGHRWVVPSVRSTGSFAVALGGGLAVLVAAPAVLYLHGLFAADSDGYLTLEWIQWFARTHGGLEALVLGPAALIGVGAVLVLVRVPAARAPLGGGAVIGMLVACGGSLLLDPDVSWLAIIVVVPAGVALALALPGPLLRPFPPRDVAGWPLRVIAVLPVAVVLIAHTYAVRVFGCPDAGMLPPGVERIADAGEVFQLAVGEGGRVVAMTERAERRIARVVVQPAVGPMGWVDPGEAIPAPGQDGMHPVPEAPIESFLPGETYARPEELVYAPGPGRFFGTVLSADPKYYEKTNSPQNDVNNMIVAIDGAGERAVRTYWASRQCWVGTLVWDAPRDRLLLGCEYEPAVLSLDPSTGAFGAAVEDERLGDVAGIAVDDRPGGDATWVVSMWNSPRLTELGPDLVPRREVVVGSGRYALAFDAQTGRLFTTAYYRSRLRILDADSLETIATVRTGLGTRALAIDAARDRVLVSSVYDGVVRVCDRSGDVKHRIRVGGHVKDIAIDSGRGFAYFASRCGLFRVDLQALEGGS